MQFIRQILSLSNLLFLLCFGLVSYKSWQCFDKYLSNVRSVEVTYDDQTTMDFPSFTLCPEWPKTVSSHSPQAYDSKVLEKCNKTLDDLIIGWFEGSIIQGCSGDYVFENAVPKLADFDIEFILVLSAVGHIPFFIKTGDSRLISKEWIMPGLGKCFTLTLSHEITSHGIGSVHIKTGRRQFRLYLHSLGKFINWPPYATGVSGWKVQPGEELYIHMDNFQYIQYHDVSDDEICNDDPGYLQDECLADLIKMDSAELGCQSPYGPHKGILCQDRKIASQAKAKFWLDIYRESECKVPCRFLMSASATSQSRRMLENSNGTMTVFLFKRQIQKSTSRIAYKELELMAEVGGYVGLFLGLSFYHVGDQLIEIVKQCYRKFYG